ncbi:HNH endonuclease [Ferruginibacter sp. SUN106]|uniref:HNH endonuclease n=1 Tax=Ferruginibacter sp. SUN106 TaxID=2978348 RepID=UPI003D36EBBA
MRNPKWHRDEIILALDLYFQDERGSVDSRNPKIIELSEVINQLPIFQERPDEVKFRNPNGVSLKLSNFMAIDPDFDGKGMTSFSKLDEEVFKEFANDKKKLHSIATEIKKVAKDIELREKVFAIEDDESTLTDSVIEGQVLYKLHKVRERDSRIIQSKKNHVLSLVGFLSCEICAFDFHKFYGEAGRGFIECHHKTPLAGFKASTRTTLEDLALVCSNCHRIIHRSIDVYNIDTMKAFVENNKSFNP